MRNAPGLFQDGQSLPVAMHEDGSAVTADAPAKRGELLTMYGTGFGPTDHGRPFGFPVPGDAGLLVVDPVRCRRATSIRGRQRLCGARTDRHRRGAVPAGRWGRAGNVSVRITVNGKDSNTVALPVQ